MNQCITTDQTPSHLSNLHLSSSLIPQHYFNLCVNPKRFASDANVVETGRAASSECTSLPRTHDSLVPMSHPNIAEYLITGLAQDRIRTLSVWGGGGGDLSVCVWGS